MLTFLVTCAADLAGLVGVHFTDGDTGAFCLVLNQFYEVIKSIRARAEACEHSTMETASFQVQKTSIVLPFCSLTFSIGYGILVNVPKGTLPGKTKTLALG